MSMFYRTYWVNVGTRKSQCIWTQDTEDDPLPWYVRWYLSIKYWSRLTESIHYGRGYISWLKKNAPFQEWIKGNQ